jgi:hypothetical protein
MGYYPETGCQLSLGSCIHKKSQKYGLVFVSWILNVYTPSLIVVAYGQIYLIA